jgi:hypothetical protein
MPIAETPLEQDELAEATKWTGEPEVAPLPGELTETPATAGIAKLANRHTTTKSFPEFITKSPASFRKSPRGAAKLLWILGRVLLTFKENQ